MSRLVVVANRVGPVKDSSRAGGLAVALVEALRDSGGLWFGWSGEVSTADNTRPNVQRHGQLSTATVDLASADYDDYYNGFANSTLWPLFHYRIDLSNYDREHFAGYLRVNRRFAKALKPLLRKDDVLWVHDYHFFAFGEELRRTGCRQPMGLFLHIPFPAPEVLTTLPVHRELIRALFAYDVLGFQTETDRRCFVNYVVNEADGAAHDDGRVTAFDRTIVAAVFPIGIDTEGFAKMATTKEALRHRRRWEGVLRNRKAILGVDRLDYTKGLPERFKAFEQLLRVHPDNRGRVSFMQLAPPSRADVAEYIEIRQTLESLSGSINGEFSEFDWTPLRYINRAFSRQGLAGIYRASQVGLITPLRDGMNLVAKEYVAAQSRANPGVLVLSRFAGAAAQMDGALIVNPYDTDGVAEALQTALKMPLGERKERWKQMIGGLRRENVAHWRDAFLETLRSAVVRTR